MSKAEKNEMMEVCELRKSFGYACHNCVYSDVCEEYKAKAKAKATAANAKAASQAAKKGMFLSLTRQILFLLPLIVILPRLFGIDLGPRTESTP